MANTVLVSHPTPDEFVQLIRKRFPDLRVWSANDAASLDRYVAEADVLLSNRFQLRSSTRHAG
ncbi:hypothetical protein [Bradyrhizobium sp. 150]|uniref:hypothetical protein n=1 Tax=Bradyrhizobium sp. 150 TaxID=2782625 RepID=UPI001FF9E710|nr:hypothetical protein [Bradyrhizobium sp. 150]